MCKLVTLSAWLYLVIPCAGSPAQAVQQAAVGKQQASQMDRQRIAIISVFCNGRVNLKNPCRYGKEALVVSQHESGPEHWFGATCYDAQNGQYHGCFQMGSSERAKYGDGAGWWNQARAAYKYFIDTHYTWSPWSCKPSGYCY